MRVQETASRDSIHVDRKSYWQGTYAHLPVPITPGPRVVPPPGALLVPVPITPRPFPGSNAGALLDSIDDVAPEGFPFNGEADTTAEGAFDTWVFGDVTICSVGGDIEESELRRAAEPDVEGVVV